MWRIMKASVKESQYIHLLLVCLEVGGYFTKLEKLRFLIQKIAMAVCMLTGHLFKKVNISSCPITGSLCGDEF